MSKSKERIIYSTDKQSSIQSGFELMKLILLSAALQSYFPL